MGIDQNIKKENKDIVKKNINENIIIGIIKIMKNNYKQRIINSYENVKRENPKNHWLWDKNPTKNEKEIKKCEIFINEERIKFNYYYNFPKEGNYIIKYVFKRFMTSTNFMFFGCDSLISLDLSNFNT